MKKKLIAFFIFTICFASLCSFEKKHVDQKSSRKNKTFLLSKLTFESDIPFSKEEFLYLTNLHSNTVINNKKINHAYKMLMKKNRFSSININITNYKSGKLLHFILKGNWILKKLNFKGITFGKQHYVNLYDQQPGDVFDITLHEGYIELLKKTLHNEGYFDSNVIDELFYTQKNKTISAKIFVKRKSRFLVKEIQFKISTKRLSVHKTNELKQLEQALTKKFQKDLLLTSYSRKQINKKAKKIRLFLKNKGYINNRLSLTLLINKKNKFVSVLFNIQLGKKLKILFSGNKFFSKTHLREKILGLDQPDWLLSPNIISEQLMHEYYKNGYWNAQVKYKKTDINDFLFTIHEGNPILIDRIEVKNLTTQKAEITSFFWIKLLKTKILDQNLLSESIEKLKTFYFTKGFWDFSIIEKRFIKNITNNHYTILLIINKGLQRFWEGSAIKNFEYLEKFKPFTKYHSNNKTGLIPFDLNWIQEQKNWLINYFKKKEYWNVKIQPQFRITTINSDNSEKKTNTLHKKNVKVFVDWHILLGKQVRFGKLLLRGNTKLPFKRIIKEIKFKEGDLWNKNKIELTRKKLKKLDIFKQVHLQPYKLATHKSTKPVILTLIDDDPIELRLRAGYFLTSKNFLFKRQSTPKFGGTFTLKNPTNRADKLMFDTDITRFERKLNLTYQQPSMLGLPVTGRIKGYANKYVHPVQIGSSGSAYEAEQKGFLLGISDEYKENYFWAITVGNEWMKTSRVRGNLKLDKKMIDRTSPYFFIEPSLIIDKLDNRINTTKGSFSFVSLKLMLPENTGTFTARLMAEQSLLIPIYKDIIIAARIRFGHIFKRSFELVMPIERFYLGGPYSVRGYEKDALPPLGVSEKIKNGNIVKDFTIQGGSSMINGNLEIRFPLLKKLGAVLFQDVGALSQSGFLGLSETWFPSSGVGLRYKTPIGAIRFDIGWKWKKRLKEDSSYAWYLTLGEAF